MAYNSANCILAKIMIFLTIQEKLNIGFFFRILVFTCEMYLLKCINLLKYIYLLDLTVAFSGWHIIY